MSIKDLKERLSTTNFGYIVYPDKKTCVEIEDLEKAQVYAKIFGGTLYDHFPYTECGYEDPYNFTNDWTVFTENGEVKYEVNNNGLVEEVSYGIVEW